MPGPDPHTQTLRVLINPSARSGRGVHALSRLRAASPEPHPQPAGRPRAWTFDWVESRSPAHFCDLVRQAQDPASGPDVLAVAGGDGTVTLALQALLSPDGATLHQRVPLAVLPTGSGNDFAHAIGSGRDLHAAWDALLTGAPRTVDVGVARPLATAAPVHPFCCVASIGLDELSLRHIHTARVRRSKALNLYAALRGLVEYRPRRVRIRWQGGQFDGDIMFCAVTNTRSYGGGFHVCPAAQVDDGLLDLCIVPRMAKPLLLAHFPRILRGTHGRVPAIRLAQSPWVQIDGDAPAPPVCIDGDLPRCHSPVELRALPRRLCVWTRPANQSAHPQPATTPHSIHPTPAQNWEAA